MLTQIRKSKDEEMVLPVTFRPAIELAIASFDQFRVVAGLQELVRLSFDQTAVEASARMHGITVTPRVAKDLAILQAEGLKIMRDAA